VIIGNVAFYGATSGEAYISGVAGERFCVRNSGVHAVVEGVGDHACEYMTGGRVVVLGRTGRNFAAGMSGGLAYVFDHEGDFPRRCNRQMVEIFEIEDAVELESIRQLIARHVEYTGSPLGREILENWLSMSQKLLKVYPNDYRRVIEAQTRIREMGISQEEAVMVAFNQNAHDLARVGGT
jgi:glutamate synthase (ferredoxin)